MSGDVTVISGPTAVGKGTVVQSLKARHPQVWVSVSATTRPPRRTEIDGVHYHFVDDAEFDRLIEHDGLLEWAEYAGNRYGTPVEPLRKRLATGAPALLEIELQGARQVRWIFDDLCVCSRSLSFRGSGVDSSLL